MIVKFNIIKENVKKQSINAAIIISEINRSINGIDWLLVKDDRRAIIKVN